jgi:hypothetical protein
LTVFHEINDTKNFKIFHAGHLEDTLPVKIANEI